MRNALKWVGIMLLAIVAIMLAAPLAHAAPTTDLHHLSLPFLIGAVTPTTLTELTDLAKDYYSDVYVPLMNTDTVLKNQLEKLEGATFTGRKWIFGVKTSVGGGASNAGANKSLPPADEGKYDQGEMTVVRTYVRMALDGLVMEVTKSKAGSYRPAVAEVMADRLTAHDLEINRQCFCAGDGKVALIENGANSTTQTVEKDYGVANGGLGARHFYEGDKVAIYDAAGAILRGRRVVVGVSQDTSPNEIELDSAVSTTTGDFVTKSTDDDDNKTAGEAGGLLQSVATANFEAIPGAGRWKSKVLSNGGTLRAVNDNLVMTMIESIRQSSKSVPNLCVTTGGIQLKYSEVFLPLRRIDGQDVQLKGGYKPITFIQHGGGQIPVMVDNDCPKSRMFFINTASFRWADLVGSEWFDMDGAVFSRITDKDGAEGFIRKYWQLATVQRNANGVIEDLEDIDGIDRIAA